jgi:aspartyl-tRNA(Asn)/glutamyl-tRNA(Gln) amidotransferase subunit A
MTELPGIAAIAKQVACGERTAVEVVAGCFAAIEAGNAKLNAFRETWREDAMANARRVDERIARGDEPGPLAGAAIAVKDNIATAQGRTCCGSRILEQYESPFSATAVQRLEQAGAVMIGKTNCDEFGMGSSTEHCAFGVVRNPWDQSRVPGGSSGGSAAAVAAGWAAGALGSDTGGSIRQPASFCGVVGLKPTYGRVSRWGLVAYGSSLDQIGPLTRNVADAALLLQVMAGFDELDSTSASEDVGDLCSGLEEPVEGLRVGLPRQYVSDANDGAVNATVRGSAEKLAKRGAESVDVDLPLTKHGIATYYIIAPAEASSNLARFDGIRYGRRAEVGASGSLLDVYELSRAEGFGEEVQRRIMLGTYVLSAGYYDAYYKRAMQVRRLIREEFNRAFERCDVLLGPAAPTAAFPIGSRLDPMSMYLGDVYTVNANIAGLPAICLPAGTTTANGVALPIGVQLLARAFDEATLLRVARMLERAVEFSAVPGEVVNG